MRKIDIKLSKWIIVLNTIFYICYNYYFGWNHDPINQVEKTCDSIFLIIWALAIYRYFKPLFIKYEQWVSKD
jgi:hypothetical protein